MTGAKIDWYDIGSFGIVCECGQYLDEEDLSEDGTFICKQCGSVWDIRVEIVEM